MPSNANATGPTGKKLLSLDGGGVRGLSSLLILRHLMAELGNRLEPRRPNIKPCEYFDLIGGTSTGGIIAIMLGRLRMSVQECVDVYTDLSKRIFGRKRSKVSSGPLFYAEDLESEMRKIIRQRLGPHNEDAPLLDPLGDEACKTFVMSLQDQRSTEPHRLRTYPSAHRFPCTIWQAARATSAAKTFFDSIMFGNPPVEWIDAGLGFNNPVRQLLEEAQFLWEDDNSQYDLRKEIGILVSLGTGIPDVFRPDKNPSLMGGWIDDIANRAGIPTDAIKQMKDIVLNAERVHEEIALQFRSQGMGKVYHRYNVSSLGNIDLGDYEKEEIMTVDTNAYLNKVRFDIKDCAILMKQFSVYEPPLELYGELPDEILLSNEIQEQQLRVNGIPLFEFSQASKILAKKQALSIARSTVSWNELVMASILDNRARKRLSDFYRSDDGIRAKTPSDIAAITRHIGVQMESNADFKAAFRLYIRVRRFAKAKGASSPPPVMVNNTPLSPELRLARRETDEESTERVLDGIEAWYCWCTHRLAGVSHCLGMIRDALLLYDDAWKRRQDLRIRCERDIKNSRDGLDRMRELLA